MYACLSCVKMCSEKAERTCIRPIATIFDDCHDYSKSINSSVSISLIQAVVNGATFLSTFYASIYFFEARVFEQKRKS